MTNTQINWSWLKTLFNSIFFLNRNYASQIALLLYRKPQSQFVEASITLWFVLEWHAQTKQHALPIRWMLTAKKWFPSCKMLLWECESCSLMFMILMLINVSIWYSFFASKLFVVAVSTGSKVKHNLLTFLFHIFTPMWSMAIQTTI